MEFTLGLILFLLFIHWFCDFVLQTHKMAVNKSSSFKWLVLHTLVYSSVFFLMLLCSHKSKIYDVFIFSLITFFFHTITDFITSKVNKYFWEQGDTHNFFVSVGFDQLLHYIQIFVTYQIIFL